MMKIHRCEEEYYLSRCSCICQNLIGAATRESVFHPFDDRNRFEQMADESVKNLIGAATRESVFHPFDDRNRYMKYVLDSQNHSTFCIYFHAVQICIVRKMIDT